MECPSARDAARARLTALLERFERLMVPHSGFAWGEGIYLPAAGDPHEDFKRDTLVRAFGVYEAARAVVANPGPTAEPPCFDGADVDGLEVRLQGDADCDAYVRLLQLCAEICETWQLWQVDDRLRDARERVVDAYAARVVELAADVHASAVDLEIALAGAVRDFRAFGDDQARRLALDLTWRLEALLGRRDLPPARSAVLRGVLVRGALSQAPDH